MSSINVLMNNLREAEASQDEGEYKQVPGYDV